ncbi:mucin-5AC-like isoform X2 [Daphnia pulex]|uniref:mucin-5AC-like isoform X1 n=1 Tax=Daphnia pulex TaxID=6669 RepID=UPI001EE01E4E|nr:mucin-5AC-like isoform X1 [Daphnia pulex]XP_046440724.1 mucin-5AC-like isoform X2 [Daphnia pulex]
MDCKRVRCSWLMSLSANVPRWNAFFLLLAVLLFTGQAATVDMPQIGDMASIGSSGFSCEGKVIGGYYADIASKCQMFHVCTLGQEGEIQDIKFLCLAGTVFDQETRVCERVDEVDCANSEAFYNLNLDLYGQHGLILQTGRKVPSGEAGSFADEQNLQQTDTFYDYADYDEVVTSTVASTTSTAGTTSTPAPTTTETTTTAEATTTTTNSPAPTTVEPPTSPIISQLPSFSQPQNELSAPSTLAPPLIHSSPTTAPEFQPAQEIPQPRLPSEIAEDEDVLRLLGQIEADVPRIPSFGKSSGGSRANVFVPRVRREDAVTSSTPGPRRNRTRKPGTGRRGNNPTTLRYTSETQTGIVSTPAAITVDDKGPFTCIGRINGGFYADVSSGCRRFYTCGVGKKNRVVSHTFTCGTGLLFDQATLTCQDIDKVDCALSPTFFYLNDPALRPAVTEPMVTDTFQSFKTTTTTTPSPEETTTS